MRLSVLIITMALISILPRSIIFYKKDNLPKYIIEKIDNKDDISENDNIKNYFKNIFFYPNN